MNIATKEVRGRIRSFEGIGTYGNDCHAAGMEEAVGLLEAEILRKLRKAIEHRDNLERLNNGTSRRKGERAAANERVRCLASLLAHDDEGRTIPSKDVFREIDELNKRDEIREEATLRG